MNRNEVLKTAIARVKAIKAEEAYEQVDQASTDEAVKLSIQMQMHDAIVDTISSSKLDADDLAEKLSLAVSKVVVNVPDVHIPEIKVPSIQMPTINVPEMKFPDIPAPVVNIEAPIVNVPDFPEYPEYPEYPEFPSFMDVGLQSITPKRPLHVMPVDAAGKLLAPSVGGGGGGGIKQAQVDQIVNPNVISTENSFTGATFAADAVFTGVGVDVRNYGAIGVNVKTDNATDAVITMQVSFTGVAGSWSGPTRNFADTRFSSPHMWRVEEPYFRLVYTNGTTEATNIHVQTVLLRDAEIILGHQLDEVLLVETEAVVTRPATGFDLDVARKHITGQRSFFFFGFNDAVDSTWQDIHPQGGDIAWLEEAVTLEVSSSNGNDTSGGSGVQSIEVHGLSDTGVDQDEVIVMGGLATTESALTYRRVNKVHSETNGTYGGSHFGKISVAVRGANSTLAVMTGEEGVVGASVNYGSGEAGHGFWSVPLGKVMYITRLEVIPDVSGNKTVDVVLYERENILDTTTPFAPRRVLWQERAVTQNTEKVFKSHIKIKALTDIWFRAVSSGTSPIAVALDFYLVDADSSGA